MSSLTDIQLEFFEVGHFAEAVDGLVHHKTCPYTIIAQPLEGHYEIQVGRRRELVPKGGLFLLPAHVPIVITHRANRRGLMAARWIHMRFSLFGQVDFFSLYEIPLVFSASEGRALGALVGEALRASPEEGVAAWITRQEIALKILRSIDESFPVRAYSPEQSRFERVFSHIRDNSDQPLDVKTLSKIAGLSPAQFHVLFKKAMGVGPISYVRRLRLEAASRQLAVTDESISQIAEAHGFADAFHFSHCFKAHFGMAPRSYRQQAMTMMTPRSPDGA